MDLTRLGIKPEFTALEADAVTTTPGVANLWRMRHTWRISYLKVAHCTFLMTLLLTNFLLFFLFALHRCFSVENKTSDIVHRHCQWKTGRLRA